MATKILELTDANAVQAAGGVLCRDGDDGEVEIAIIHRPAYDDWTLPKGKVEPDESAEECALREVWEETGFKCELVRPLGCTAYVDRRGRNKVACYWSMELLWLPLEDAVDRLTYSRDKALLTQQELP